MRSNVVIHRGQKPIKEMTPATSGVMARFPTLFPIWNPYEIRGLCRRSYFGPRTCGGSINPFSSKCSGFLIRVSPSHPYWGRCNVIVPLHLPDALEYKFLGCIQDHHRLWMAPSARALPTAPSPARCAHHNILLLALSFSLLPNFSFATHRLVKHTQEHDCD